MNDGEPKGSFNNSRLGATVSFPLGGNQSLKVLYSNGVRATAGSDFQTIAVAYQIAWFDRQKP